MFGLQSNHYCVVFQWHTRSVLRSAYFFWISASQWIDTLNFRYTQGVITSGSALLNREIVLLAFDGLLIIPRFGHNFLEWSNNHSPIARVYLIVCKKMQWAMDEHSDRLLSVDICTLDSSLLFTITSKAWCKCLSSRGGHISQVLSFRIINWGRGTFSEMP